MKDWRAINCLICGDIVAYYRMAGESELDLFVLCPECKDKKERGDFVRGL